MPHTFLPQLQLRRRHIVWLAASVVGIALVVTGLALSMPSIERQLDRWQLLPKHQSLTELSIDDPASLPSTYKPGQTTTVGVDINNRTGAFQTYTYLITENDASGHSMELATGSVDVAAGDSTTILKNVTLTDMGKRAYVRITLTNANGLSIGYWLERQ